MQWAVPNIAESAFHLFKAEIETLRDYGARTETFLAGEAKVLDQWLNSEGAKLSPEEADHFFDAHLDERFSVREEFPSILRNSLVVSAYSQLELYVRRISGLAQHYSGATQKADDLPGKAILFKHQKYLKKVTKIAFPDRSADWKAIKELNLIRNCIVHSLGHIPSDPKSASQKKLVALIQADPHLSESDSGRIAVAPEFLPKTVSHLVAFGRALAGACAPLFPTPAAKA